jgi:hypothetical protein
MQPVDHVVTWDEFRTAFRAHHIPEGLIERKLNEFLNLTKGTRTIMQYAQVFNHLCQYTGYHADSDACKRDRFRRGLSTKLKERLNLVKADNFNEQRPSSPASRQFAWQMGSQTTPTGMIQPTTAATNSAATTTRPAAELSAS